MNINKYKLFVVLLLLINMLPQFTMAQFIFHEESIRERYELSTSVVKWVVLEDNKAPKEDMYMYMIANGDIYFSYSKWSSLAYGETLFFLHRNEPLSRDPMIEDIGAKAIVEGFFLKGKKEGYWKMKQFFKRKNGIYDRYVLLEENYRNGALHGVRRILDEEGSVIYSTIFVEGTGVYCEYYSGTKQLLIVGCMLNGKRDGCWEYYSKEGKCIKKEYYENGTLNGNFEVFDNSAKLLYKTIFVDGTGYYKSYNADGEILVEGQLRNGKRCGVWYNYYYYIVRYDDSRRCSISNREYTDDQSSYLEELDENIIGTYYIEDTPFYIRVAKKVPHEL